VGLLSAGVLNIACLRLKSDLRHRGVGANVRAVGQWAADGVCLRHTGMHGVPHLRGMRASTVVRVVVMGRYARGIFGSRGDER